MVYDIGQMQLLCLYDDNYWMTYFSTWMADAFVQFSFGANTKAGA
jgi:hypothetical protein